MLTVATYYQAIDPDLSVAMRQRIKSAIGAIADAPGKGSMLKDGRTRKWPVPRSQLRIFYTVEDNVLLIKHIRHVREDWVSQIGNP